ncbi:MAG: hypothetical protein U0452_03810 [Anaerolineae bacterium]
MLNTNDLRLNSARRQEMERFARRQQNAARASQRPQRRPAQSAWSRVAALFL